MDSQRYQTIRSIFHEVTELAEPERTQRLDELCDDAGIRSEVELLLAAADEPTTLIDSALINPTIDIDIPGFTIMRLIGEGGMGSVYEARQHQPSRRVAIKMLRGGTGTAALLKRFEREGQVLALLKHPGIAQIFQVGSIAMHGRRAPFIAMELIEGHTLLRHASANNMGDSERIEIGAQICDALEHAHAHGVTHRDLKPGNILVDERGQPKILDFGIARIESADGTAPSLQTEAGQVLGTAAYMSPEQASGDPNRIDTRSDVYSLGVLLYELLSGRLPFDIEKLPLPEAIRTISKGEPTRIGTIDARYRGDVETILVKATDRDPTRRYQSAAELALDLRRYLANQPIAARPPSAIYQIRKFTRRNRGLVASIAIVFALLASGVIVLGVLLNRESSLRFQAERSLEQANSAENFMEDVLLGITPKETAALDTSLLRRMLDRARVETVDEIADPIVRARMLSIIGRAYHGIFEFETASTLLEQSSDLFAANGAAFDEERILTTSIHAHSLYRLGRFEPAAEIFESIIDEASSLGDLERKATTLRQLAELRMDQGSFEQALEFVDQSREIISSDDDSEVARTDTLKAAILRRLGRADEARNLFESARTRFEANGDLAELSNVLNSLAILARRRGDLHEAERYYRESIDTRTKLDPRKNPDTAATHANLGRLLLQLDRPAEAIVTLEHSIRQHEELFGTDHPNIAYPLATLADALRTVGRHQDGLEAIDRALRLASQGFEESHPIITSSRLAKGRLLTVAGRHAEAVESLSQTLDAAQGFGLDPAQFLAPLWEALGDAHHARGELDASQRALEKAHSCHEPGSPAAQRIAARIRNPNSAP